MKKINAIILFMIGLSLSSFSSEKTKNDLMNSGIKGNVKKVSETTFVGVEKFGEFQKQSTKSNSVSFYNTLGNLALTISYNIDGSLKDSTNYKYDLNGNRTEINSFKSDGVLSGKIARKYNQANKQIEFNLYKSDGSLYLKFTDKYDVNGNNIETLRYDSEGNLSDRNTYLYDVNGKKIEENSFESDGSLSNKSTFKYNVKGFVVEENTKYSTWTSRTIFKYDTKDNLIEKEEYNDGVIKEKFTYKYDENSNLIEESSVDSDGSLSPVISNKYDYDSNGNWIKKDIFKNGIQFESTERILEYY